MSYTKAHPFGYKAVKGQKASHFREQMVDVQTIKEKKEYKVARRDREGNVIKENGKVLYDTFTNEFTRPVKNFNPKPKRGRTLGEMVFESVPTV